MSSDNVYMINDDGQIVLMQNTQHTPQQNIQTPSQSLSNGQKTSISDRSSQINPVIQPLRQNVNRRNIGTVKYTQPHTQPQTQPQTQPVYQRPQLQSFMQNQQNQTQQVNQRPQIQSAPVLNTRTLNSQRQDELLSYNNWKKMNMSLNQMVNEQNPYQTQQTQQTPDTDNDLIDKDENNEEVLNQDIVPNSNRAKYGAFISNNTSHNTRNHGSIRSNNIPSYLAIRKAHNNESIYL